MLLFWRHVRTLEISFVEICYRHVRDGFEDKESCKDCKEDILGYARDVLGVSWRHVRSVSGVRDMVGIC